VFTLEDLRALLTSTCQERSAMSAPVGIPHSTYRNSGKIPSHVGGGDSDYGSGDQRSPTTSATSPVRSDPHIELPQSHHRRIERYNGMDSRRYQSSCYTDGSSYSADPPRRSRQYSPLSRESSLRVRQDPYDAFEIARLRRELEARQRENEAQRRESDGIYILHYYCICQC